jgi:hypothetical protein
MSKILRTNGSPADSRERPRSAANLTGKGAPEAVRLEGFPVDLDFPQLTVACDPNAMLNVFRRHLRPAQGKVYRIESCVPYRFRFRQSTARCVLQYELSIGEPHASSRRTLWVTGLLYANEGEADLTWEELKASGGPPAIPDDWRTFEPACLIPELHMLVQVFPLDRRLPNLLSILGGAMSDLEPLLLDRFGAGRWQLNQRRMEPTRYRTELGAALRYTIQAREAESSNVRSLRCYVKVYRDDRGANTLQLLQLLRREVDRGRLPFDVVRPIAYLDRVRALVLEEAPGRSLTQLLTEGTDPETTLRRVAQAVAAFNQSDVAIPRHETHEKQLKDVRLAANLVRWARPELRPTVDQIAASVENGIEEVPLRPIHGDLKADHVFLSGDRVVFIDLDSAARADPVRDPAHLASYLAGGVGLQDAQPTLIGAASAAFLDEYFRRVPSSWRRRFPLHYAGALLEVASGIFRRQEPRWPEKIAAVIELAQEALFEGYS